MSSGGTMAETRNEKCGSGRKQRRDDVHGLVVYLCHSLLESHIALNAQH